MLRIHHRKTSGLPDDPTYDVGSGEWNDSIVVKDDGGGSADGAVFVRKAADVDGWTGIPSAAGVLACSVAGALPAFRALTTADLPATQKIWSGPAAPTAAIGALGDFYVNTISGKWAGPKSADALVPWPPIPRYGAYGAAVIQDGASHYWRLDEASGTLAVDVIGAANGTISGGVTLAQPGALSDGNKAMAFNGTTGKIVTAAAVTMSIVATIEAWVKVASGVVDERPILSMRLGPSFSDLEVAIITGNPYLFSTGSASSSKVVTDGLWHHLVYIINGSTASFYVDGVFDRTQAFARAASFTGPTSIGWDAYGYFWPGSLDEVAIYPLALTAAQIAAHYAARLET